jgi:uncharacterized membrane protein YkvA (DUF1232 family)
MSAALLKRTTTTAMLAVVAALALLRVQQSVSLGDLLAIGATASVVTAIGLSLFRSPAQFFRALYERIKYVLLVPVCVMLMVAILAVRLAFLFAKLAFKAVVGFGLWLVYLISPIDLIPDLIPILGLIDDIILFVTVSVWVVSGAMTSALKTQISVARPTTSFP